MIRVARDRIGPNGVAVLPLGTWTQRAMAQTDQARTDGVAHVVSDLYRDADVKAALEELFFGKCAYCETGGLVGFAWDVEHFRPKGRVAEDPTHPGYYWLAYTWSNLYPSCVFCNQRRADKPTYSDPTLGRAVGKLDQFPLEDHSLRVMNPTGDLATERPAIVDPCVDDPSGHLVFTPDGSVRSAPGSTKGQKSIDVFGLNRKRLLRGRRDALNTVERLVSRGQSKGMTRQAALDLALEVLAEPAIAFSAVVIAAIADPAAFGL
jgi:uncharacterized protein (TIGR02646 family)